MPVSKNETPGLEDVLDSDSTMRNYPHVVGEFMSTAWAIMPEKLQAMINFLDAKIEGVVFSQDEIESRIGRRATRFRGVKGNVAILGLHGVIGHRMNCMSAISGGTSTELFGADFDRAIDDKTVGAVVMDVNSPGGSVAGVIELADKIFKARGSKPIVAVANSLMASAAFWVASAADEIVVTPSGEIGSVGVVATHIDQSLADENFGRKVSIIKAGKFKAEANPHEPLSAEGRDHIQGIVDSFYNDFVGALARHRGTTAARVRSDFGQGRVVRASDAVEAGMADRIGTLQDVIVQMEPKGKAVNAARHAIEILKLKSN